MSALLARRYLFSRNQKTVVNVISWISLIGITVSTMAMIVVLSVYNGIGELTQTLFNVFDSELVVKPAQGKTFHISDIGYDDLQNVSGVDQVSAIVEENALIRYGKSDVIVTLRGVDKNYGSASGIDTLVAEGSYLLKEDGVNYLLVGWTIMANLGVNSMSNIPMTVYIPKRGTTSVLSVDSAFAFPSGTFRIQEEIDKKYVIADIDFVRNLMSYESDEVTALAITLNDDADLEKVKALLQAKLGDGFTINDRYDQNPLYYKVFRSERLGVFLVLTLIVLIASLNLIASLSLLIINKRKDIHTLRTLGLSTPHIRKVFFTEGILIALVGVVSGLVLGAVICLLQQKYGIVKLGANAVVPAFPVAMRAIDFIATFLIVTVISTLIVLFTVRRAKIGMVVLLVVALALGSCSRKGIHMSKHRKSRRCNCPTFTQSDPPPQSSTVYYDEGGSV
ncbi:MAG: ABC transporter permease [Bacteroidales bacterium]|nr:ABC transporter permease [Bacteroidales bacterium]